MTNINETHVEAIIAACSENSAAIAESLNLCFDRGYRVEVGETSVWDADAASADLDGPGLSVLYRVGTQGVLCLIPESLPLPDWYAAPGDSENSRLQTLSFEWSINMLPADLEAEEYVSAHCENLKQQILDSGPAEWAGVLELLVYEDAGETDSAAASPADASEDSTEESPEAATEAPIAKMYLVAAIERPPLSKQDAKPAKPEETPAPVAAAQPSQPAGMQPAAANAFSSLGTIDQKMLGLPVTISVRLAEKKIELGQLASIVPGGLVTFSKGCESLLDLYVNNHLFGRGEAIKIGEKFGLKVTHVGVEPERKQRVL